MQGIDHIRQPLVLLQDRNELLFGITLALHFGTSLGQNYREIPHSRWPDLRGYGHNHSIIAKDEKPVPKRIQ